MRTSLTVLTAALAAALTAHAVSTAGYEEAAITITAARSDRDLKNLNTPALGVGIGSDQIGAINAANVEDTLRYAPNLIVRKRYIGDPNATLSFRNMHTSQTPRALVTVDGFLISDFLGASFDTAPKWAVLAPDDVARAEIIYGPTSARYSGNSLGGTLRLDTRGIREESVRLNAQGIFQNYKYYATNEDLFGYALDGQVDLVLGNRGGISAGYRHFENEGQPQQWRTVAPGTPLAEQAIVDTELGFPLRIAAQDSVVDSREDQIRLRGNFDLTDGWTIRSLAALLLDEEDAADPVSFLTGADGAPSFVGVAGVTRGLSETSELLTGIGAAGALAGWSLDLTLSHYTALRDRTRSSDPVDLETGLFPDRGFITDANADWTNMEVVAERRLGAHAVAAGLSYMAYDGDAVTADTALWRGSGAGAVRTASGGETRLLGIFAEDAVSLARWASLTAGLRYEHWRASEGFLVSRDDRVDYAPRTEDALSPKLALSITPEAETEIVLSAAWATRFPTIGELYQAGLISYGPDVGELDLGGFDPSLRPERGLDLQLTGSRRFGNVELTLSGYRQRVEDTLFSQTILVPGPDDPDMPVSQSLVTNIGETRTWGADIILAAEDIFLDGLALDANISWIDAKITRNPLNPALVGNRFPRVPEWRANASLRYAVSRALDVAANVRHQDTPERNIENNATSRCDTFYCVSPFTFVDLKARIHFKRFDIDLGVDNLLDEKAFVFHPYPGRTFVAGLRWTGGL